MAKDSLEIAQCQFNWSIARIERLTRDLKFAHRRIVGLTIDGDAKARSAMGEASIAASHTSRGVHMDDPFTA